MLRECADQAMVDGFRSNFTVNERYRPWLKRLIQQELGPGVTRLP
jgi:hypothetical protein